jgi:hypothetical protein
MAHRGPDPRDRDEFAPERWAHLREAVADLSWLLSRGYADVSALKLVGDRWYLTARQRMAVRRSSCADGSRTSRRRSRVDWPDMVGRPLWLDGFNVLTTVEAALGGAIVLRGRDDCDRDIAGVHGTYRRVEETRPALERVGEYLASKGVGPCTWLLDRPVSNSGRLREIMLATAASRGWPWSVDLPFNPDAVLVKVEGVVATSDSVVLDRCRAWVNLTRSVIEETIAQAFVVDLGDEGP